ncbi:RagB/SusD family nutrient uptake outer membrane protein [Pedobacter sp.]|uniref:RagB/SusD family nutrient uptake outer membrane protein n=1 Tax=Pedobacter sp. TaxID=1411316 RepID=UPI003D7F8A1D
MKKYIKSVLFVGIVWSMTGMVSCKKYLDRDPEATVSAETAFKDFRSFQGYTEELYSCIPDFTNRYYTNSWNWGEDEIQSTVQNFHIVNKIDNGDFWGWQKEFDGWGAGFMDNANASTNNDRFTKGLYPLAWYGIRKVNLGLENLPLMVNATEEERNLIKGQLLFFRGWFHFQLIQYFGGLPYVDKVLPSDEPFRLPRLKYQECAEKAAQDFRAAADLLPINWDNTAAGVQTFGKNQLRINKIMALGYLGKNYLWAASPLMNLESKGSKTYDAELSKKAADAFAELLKLTEGGQAPHKLLPFAQYSNNFYTTGQNFLIPGGTEAIFSGPYWGAHQSTYGTAKQYTPAIVGADALVFAPTANYVNYYGMKNGLPISNSAQADPSGSGYDPQLPWRDRDPRFYNDIIYDGVKVVQGTLAAAMEPHRYANLYTAGSYRDDRSGSRTGYMNFKFVPRTANNFDQGWNYGQNLNIKVPYMRLADIYLMYAEAVATGYGSATATAPGFSKTAVDAINVIRDRAGVGHVAAQFLGSADEFMKEVRRERAVELAFEGHRFNDLRRWHLLAEVPYTLKTAAEFDRAAPLNAAADTKLNRIANYRERVILQRPFSEKHYWLPLKRADVNMYPEFFQNPGW